MIIGTQSKIVALKYTEAVY